MIQIATKNGSAMLMARIVDQAGVVVWPENVDSIAYALFELNSRGMPKPVEEHYAEWLDVDEVMFDSLQLGEWWSLDVSGYNFRHELELPLPKGKGRAAKNYVAAYRFYSIEGTAHIIYFELKGISR